MSEELRVLKKQRATFKSQLTRIKTFFQENENPSLAEINVRKIKIEEIYKNYQTVNVNICILDDTVDHEADEIEFENNYYFCAEIIDKFLSDRAFSRELTATAISNESTSDRAHKHTNIKLPRIDLPTFDGAFVQWKAFHDTFKSLVHENESTFAVQKFHYLKSALKGEAATVLSSLDASAENYAVAWSLLIKRYNQPRRIIQGHLKALFEIPVNMKESTAALRSLTLTAEMHVNALKALKINVQEWDPILVYIILSKLDKNTRRHWDRSLEDDAMPTFSELLAFLNKFSRDDELATSNIRGRIHENSSGIQNHSNFKHNRHSSHTYVSTQSSVECPICKGNHYIFACDTFLKFTVSERVDAVKGARLCFNCLRSGHSVNRCIGRTCNQCHQKHNTLLHRVDQSNSQRIASNEHTTVCDVPRMALTAYLPSEVLLSTARVTILDHFKRPVDCKVLLDSGSQTNFITENLASVLQLPTTAIDLPVSGLNQLSTRIKNSVQTTIKSKHTTFSSDLTFLIVPRISNLLPSQQINRSLVQIPANIKLADPDFHKPCEIDALIGAELFYRLLCIGQIKLPDQAIILQKTVLGWIISGAVLNSAQQPKTTSCHISITTLESQLNKFWELEEYPSRKYMSSEEEACEYHFQQNTRRDSLGRYIVKLPFNDKKQELGGSYNAALKRFYALERKLEKDTALKEQYSKFIQEYERLGHMTDITNSSSTHEGCYLPHHAVIKTSSLTTKLRVVFDGSSKTENGISLNDTLMVGPTIQDDLFSLITRFRVHAYVLTADIEKMYRQVRVEAADGVYQKILWRENRDEPLKTFRLDTVTYGTASAPFLAIRCLHQLAADEGKAFPRAAIALTQDCYVDDVLTGANTFEEAIALRDELIALTSLGYFNLRQWSSNVPTLVNTLKEPLLEHNMSLDISPIVKTLGVYWNSVHDTINYTVDLNNSQKQLTKRMILSSIAQLFDPLGLLGPIIVTAKIIMQQLWKLHLDWDESVPQCIHTAWEQYKQQLPGLNNFKIARNILPPSSSNIQLHGFCDASETAYGACIYVRSTNSSGIHTVRLVCSKSRVAPLKSVVLPRLELCAAVLLSRLYQATKTALKVEFDSVRFWSDSTVALHWILTPPYQLKTFVANRVSEIQTNTKTSEWHHVSSADNPADYVSRGQNVAEFMKNQVWLHGPAWLSHSESTWPIKPLSPIDVPEKRAVVTLNIVSKNIDILEQFSSFTKLKRIVAYCFRFASNASRNKRNSGKISVAELQDAHKRILKLVQGQEFATEINDLNNNKTINKKSKLSSLNPFLDSDGILRVGGRLDHATINYDQKHPALLPRSHHITTLIIIHEHERHMHAGTQATLNAVRQHYWPIDGKNTTRRIIHKCIRCFRAKPVTINYRMGDLPENRLRMTRPFENVGVDYCGPFFIKEKRFRNRNKIKVYVAVFVCFCTRAVHLELVSDLTTEAFLASLRRFFARRGRSKNIYSDNATNFTGAKNELIEIQQFLSSTKHKGKIIHDLANEGIAWHFSPPQAPHFGGLWEASVKSFKHHMIRTIGQTLLTFEQLNTYVIEIEAILNSRPLTPMSSDPNDLTALTPSHFLIADSLMSIPEHDFKETAVNRLSVWQHLQQLKQHFWTRWYKEYLNELHVRKKWHMNTTDNIKIGTLVTIKDDNLPPMRWVLGRITDTHPGKDNITRVVTVKTAHGTYLRSVKKICPLPLDIDNH